MNNIWDAIGRSESGPYMKEDKYDWQVGLTAGELVKKYDIRFDPEQVVPSDDDLADRVYQASLDLFLELGAYCRDTSRLVKFSRDEVETALKYAPTSITYGQGKDEAVMVSRGVEDTTPPFCLCTPVGQSVAEERFVPMVQSYAQEPLADTFSSAFSQTVHGRPIKSGTPQEVEAAIWNVIKLREAAQAAGRPQIGIHNLISNAERTDAILAAVRPEFGALSNDGLAIAATAELKFDYERVKKSIFARHTSYNTYGLYGALMGGYSGGPEATAIVQVAHHFLGLLAFDVQSHCSFPLHLMQSCNSTRNLLWLISVVMQALSRNTHLLKNLAPFTASGPCTEMVVNETVAIVAAATVSGADLNLLAVARNKYPEYASGMEARIGAEAGHVVAWQGMSREQVNEIVKQLLAEYEDQIEDAPLGKKFEECYDLESVQPTQEYLDMYEESKKKLTKLGMDYSLV